jgi:hypothetical protein
MKPSIDNLEQAAVAEQCRALRQDTGRASSYQIR